MQVPMQSTRNTAGFFARTFHRLGPVTGLILGLLAASLQAQAEWEDDLQLQMESEKQCKAVSISNVVEFTTDGHDGITATVECEDGRFFQASRDRPLRAFSLAECKDEAACVAIRHKPKSE